MGIFKKKQNEKPGAQAESNVTFSGRDIYLFADVISKVGLSDYLTDMEQPEVAEPKTAKEIEANKEIAAKNARALTKVIFANISKANNEIDAFIEGVLSIENVRALGYKEYEKTFNSVFKSADFADFFMSAFTLVMNLMVG